MYVYMYTSRYEDTVYACICAYHKRCWAASATKSSRQLKADEENRSRANRKLHLTHVWNAIAAWRSIPYYMNINKSFIICNRNINICSGEISKCGGNIIIYSGIKSLYEEVMSLRHVVRSLCTVVYSLYAVNKSLYLPPHIMMSPMHIMILLLHIKYIPIHIHVIWNWPYGSCYGVPYTCIICIYSM